MYRPKRQKQYLSALESSNFQATFFESKGMGKGEKRELSFKGRTMKMRYSTRNTIVTIVDDDKLDQVISVIKESGRYRHNEFWCNSDIACR